MKLQLFLSGTPFSVLGTSLQRKSRIECGVHNCY